MQHYIHVGFGFSGKHLTREQADALVAGYDGRDEGGELQTRPRYVSFTEDYESPDWGTVVLHDFGEAGQDAGKLVTATQMLKLINKHALTPDMLNQFKVLLDQEGLGHLADKVELVLFSHNY